MERRNPLKENADTFHWFNTNERLPGNLVSRGEADARDLLSLPPGTVPSTKPTKLFVTVGDDDWEATPEEMLAVQDLFETWLKDPDNSVIVTRRGIEVQAGHLAHVKVLQIDRLSLGKVVETLETKLA